MSRQLLTALSVLSLVLGAATVVLWVRSYFISDVLRWGPNHWETTTITTVPGGLHWRAPSETSAPINFTLFYWEVLLLSLVLPLWPVVRRWGRRMSPPSTESRNEKKVGNLTRIVVDEVGITSMQGAEGAMIWRCQWEEVREIVA
jgi:hypothetical protein